MQYPRKIETAHVETLGDELCIYNWQRKEVHNLNATAASVWQLCDGRTTPQQMASRLQVEEQLDASHSEELVWLTLSELNQAHLLVGETGQAAGRTKITRRQLLKGLGVTVALLPVVKTIAAPEPVAAQSPVPTATTAPALYSIAGCQAFSIGGAGVPISPNDLIITQAYISPSDANIELRRTIILNEPGHPQDGVVDVVTGVTNALGRFSPPEFNLSTLSPTISPGSGRIEFHWEFVNADGSGTCTTLIDIAGPAA